MPAFQVDPRAATPLHAQIATQVRHAVASGALRPGEALPSVRHMAVALRVNPNTVARAYRELEVDGVVESRQGSGTFVASTQRAQPASARRAALAPLVERLAVEARVLGLDPDEVAELVRAATRKLAARSGTEER